MLSKEEYLTHLDYGVKTCPAIRDAFKELIEEYFDKNGNVKVLANIVIDEDKMKEIIDEEIKKLIVPEPYKFEDLKPNMWVYDGIEKLICQIGLISKNAIHREYVDGTISDSPFEENRFFPVQCANLIKMEVKEDDV